MAPDAKFPWSEKLSLHKLWRMSGDKMLRKKNWTSPQEMNIFSVKEEVVVGVKPRQSQEKITSETGLIIVM